VCVFGQKDLPLMRDECTPLGFALLCIVIALCGCKELRLRKLSPDGQASSLTDSREDRTRANGKSRERSSFRRSLDLEGAGGAGELSRNDGWNASPATQPPFDRAQGYRWRHFELEAVASLPPDQRPDFVDALEGSNPVVATNAAICLVRLGDGRGRDRLVETIGGREFRLPLRCAAAEALCELRDPSPLSTLRELIDRFGQYDSPPYLPELHAELLYGLAAHVDADTDDRFVAAVKSPAALVRLAAIRGWQRPGIADLPEQAADLRTDSDYQVRAAAITAMAVRRHPLALDAARGALTDLRLEVRLAAVAALGKIGGVEARQALVRLEREPEVIRAAVIAAFAELDERKRVWEGTESESWHVRKAVAAALAKWPDAGGVALARRLLTDPSLEVQKQVLDTLVVWPLEKAGPVLLEAMASSGYQSRKTAAKQLAQRWSPAHEFTADAPPERRADMVAHLRAQWTAEHGVSAFDSALGNPPADSPDSSVAPERLERAAQLVRRLNAVKAGDDDVRTALGDLSDFGPDLPAVLERLLDEQNIVLPDDVYLKVLPKYGRAFEQLDRLTSSDVHERRRAANELATLATREPISGLALTRLCELGVSETDTPVLARLFQILARDGREPAVRLAYACLGHRLAEVRRVAAGYLDAHPAPQHVRVLLPALDDKNHAVVLAAIKALGHPDMLTDTSSLERLLRSTDPAIRLAVAEALVNLGAQSGPNALDLLARDNDIDTRRQAAQIMGRHPDDRYISTLIGLLDDTLGVRTAALASLPQVVGRDVADRPDDPPTSSLERVERWKKWRHSEEGPVRGRAPD
jgi:HEAT repeat protein